MLLIFPVEWAIIQERSPKEMSFPPPKENRVSRQIPRR
jgi:hypothetical protein